MRLSREDDFSQTNKSVCGQKHAEALSPMDYADLYGPAFFAGFFTNSYLHVTLPPTYSCPHFYPALDLP